jgi:hypothetical protein
MDKFLYWSGMGSELSHNVFDTFSKIPWYQRPRLCIPRGIKASSEGPAASGTSSVTCFRCKSKSCMVLHNLFLIWKSIFDFLFVWNSFRLSQTSLKLIMWPRLASNLQFFCHSVLSARIIEVCHCTQPSDSLSKKVPSPSGAVGKDNLLLCPVAYCCPRASSLLQCLSQGAGFLQASSGHTH